MSLHPDFPVVSGDYFLTDEWRVVLPGRFNRRVEDGSVVLWRRELTFWVNVWNNDNGSSQQARLASILAAASPLRLAEQVEQAPPLIRLTYELPEDDPSRSKPNYNSVSGYVIGQAGHLQLSAYFDTPAARSIAYQVIHSAQSAA